MRRKRRIKRIALAVAVAVATVSSMVLTSPQTAHAESLPQTEPVQISNASQLAQLHPTGNYVLTADLTLNAWTPLPFSGTLDGNGHKITTPTPLFSTLTNATVHSLALAPATAFNYTITNTLTSNTNFGLLAQTATASQISKTYIDTGSLTVTTTSMANIGGFIGESDTATSITNSYSRLTLNISLDTASTEPMTINIGGLIGKSTGTTVHNTYTAPLSTLINFTTTASSQNARLTLTTGGLIGFATSSGYDVITNNFTGGTQTYTTPTLTTQTSARLIGTASGYTADTLTHNHTYSTDSLPFFGNSITTTATQQLGQYFQTLGTYTPDYTPSIWNNLNQTYHWNTSTVWYKSSTDNDFLTLQMFENFTVKISEINNGLGVIARIQELSGTEFINSPKTEFPYGEKIRILLEITAEFEPYKHITGLKRLGENGTLSGLKIADDGKTATYDFSLNGSTAGEFYGLTENVQYKLKIQSEDNAQGTIRYGTSGGLASSEPYILEYGKKEYTFYASPTSNAYAFESWTWVGVTDNPSLLLPENRLINIKFGVVGEDSAYTYLTLPTTIPTSLDGDGAIVFTLQANFTTNVCNLELQSALDKEGFDIYVGGVHVDNIVDFDSFYNEAIQVNKPLEIRIEMKEGYNFVRWEDASGRDLSKSISAGESETSHTIHLSVSDDFSLRVVFEAENAQHVDLTWLWIVLGSIAGVGLIVLLILFIKNRKNRESFVDYY